MYVVVCVCYVCYVGCTCRVCVHYVGHMFALSVSYVCCVYLFCVVCIPCLHLMCCVLYVWCVCVNESFFSMNSQKPKGLEWAFKCKIHGFWLKCWHACLEINRDLPIQYSLKSK